MKRTCNEVDWVRDFIYLAFPDKSNSINEIKNILGYKSDWSIRHIACNLKIKRNTDIFRSINHDYFKNWSHNMAWVLGFITADGNVQSNRNALDINLASKDVEILEFIRHEIDNKASVKYNNYKNQVRLTLRSKEIKEDLIKLGVVPNKTSKEYIPDELPKEYIWDYIRGLFDGDGCGRSNLSIVSASERMIDDLIRITNIGKKYIKYNPGYNKLYTWMICNKIGQRHVYDKMYENSNCLCLLRKKFDLKKLIQPIRGLKLI